MLESASPSKWAPDEIRRFYRGYHKYGSDFYKISKMVGGGKGSEMCASLWRRHQAYLSLDKKFQSEVAFLALAQDGGAAQEPVAGVEGGVGMDGADPYGEEPDAQHHLLRQQQHQHQQHNDDLSDAELRATLPQAGVLRRRNLDDEEVDEDIKEGVYDDESLAAAAVVAMASPEKHSMGGSGGGDAAEGGGTLAATRARRTPKRGPQSTGKRPKPAEDEEIYEYYDEGGVSESAKKRRQARQRLNFDVNGAGGGDAQQAAPGNRQVGVAAGGAGRGYTGNYAEKGGIDALLALAVAETEGSQDEGGVPGGAGGSGPRMVFAKSGYDYGDEDLEEEEEEEDALGVLVDDDKDEDYKAGRREGGRGRRTPHSTPHKSRSRPGSAHNTPHRIVSRGFMSPGGGGGSLRSPAGGWGGGGLDLGDGDFLGADDMPSYLQSPGGGFLAGGMHHNYVASPQNPMPRLRRRKHPPEKHALLISPLKSLLTRRQGHQALGASSAALMSIGGVAFPGQTPADDIPSNASAAELRIRHAMSVKLRKFCTFEFFYSGLDRPWYFSDNTMTELVQHVGLTPGTKLTRKEWSALRSTLGRPRRLSNNFLRESRLKLEIHRKSARNFYNQEHMDPAVAATLPRQVAVGQKVIARHPLTRQIHDGTVLTAGFDNYRIQFYRRDLGVEMVRDIDVMPAAPWDNLPMSLLAARPRLVIGGRLILNGRAMPGTNLPINNPVPPTSAAAASGGVGGVGGVLGSAQQHRLQLEQQQQQQHVLGATGFVNPNAAAASLMPADPALMAEIATNLDRKEALLAQLRQMNEDASNGEHNDPATGEVSPAFTQAYTSIAVKLAEVNDILQGKLQLLEQSAITGGGGGGGGVGGGTVGGGAAALAEELARGDLVSLPAELLQGPITKATLSNAAKNAASRVTETCRQKIEQSRRDSQQQQRDRDQPETQFVSDSHLPSGAVAPLIEGATWTLSLLQLGADRVVPASALVGALEAAILKVKPAHVVNAVLYTEIEAVMDTLKQQLLASSSS